MIPAAVEPLAKQGTVVTAKEPLQCEPRVRACEETRALHEKSGH